MRGINAARELVARLDASLARGAPSPRHADAHRHARAKTTSPRPREELGVSKARKRHRAGRASSSSPGLSGSGKSQAIRALEDLGYYCVDNLPVSLLPVMAELAERQTEHNRVAVVMDIREPRFVSDFPRVYRKLKTNKHLALAADFPRGRSRRAGAPLQRDAPAASARAGSSGDRRPVGGTRVAARRSARWPTRSSTPRSSTCTSCGSSCASSSAATSRPRNWC